jgi:hypothetical protein
MPLQEPRCDVVAGTAECTEYCQQNGFEAGFCHESRMKCQCYLPRALFWMKESDLDLITLQDNIETNSNHRSVLVPQPRD